MGYLKFLGWTLLAVLAIGLAEKLGGGRGAFIAVVVSISLFWRLGPRIMAIGFSAWVALVMVWLFAIKALLKAAPQAVAKYSASQIQMAEGFWLLVGMLLLHPLCYGLAKLATRNRA